MITKKEIEGEFTIPPWLLNGDKYLYIHLSDLLFYTADAVKELNLKKSRLFKVPCQTGDIIQNAGIDPVTRTVFALFKDGRIVHQAFSKRKFEKIVSEITMSKLANED